MENFQSEDPKLNFRLWISISRVKLALTVWLWLWLWLSALAGNSFDFVLWWITAVWGNEQRTTRSDRQTINNCIRFHVHGHLNRAQFFVIYFDWHLIYDWQLQMLRPTRSTDQRSMGNVTTTTTTTTTMRVTRATTTMFEPTANADTDT